MKLVKLTTLDNSISANLLRSKLDNEGIPCVLNNENFTNLMPYYYNVLGSGVQVLVPEEFVEQAKAFLPVQENKLVCPNCQSENIRNKIENGFYKFILIVIALLLAGLIGNLLNDYTCQDCGHEFKS